MLVQVNYEPLFGDCNGNWIEGKEQYSWEQVHFPSLKNLCLHVDSLDSIDALLTDEEIARRRFSKWLTSRKGTSIYAFTTFTKKANFFTSFMSSPMLLSQQKSKT